jgi:hypothetical protein
MQVVDHIGLNGGVVHANVGQKLLICDILRVFTLTDLVFVTQLLCNATLFSI